MSAVELPPAVRFTRTWWLREARWHVGIARLGHHPKEALRSAAQARSYATEILRRWHALGAMPKPGNGAVDLENQAYAHELTLASIQRQLKAGAA